MSPEILDYEEYTKFINEPKHLVNPVRDVRMFDPDIVEYFSKTPWQAVPVVWIPIIMYNIWQSQLSMAGTFYGLLGGFFIWTFAEYALHRFLFHAEDRILPDNPKAIALHFMFHGIHHAFPMDKYRLVFPPVMGLIMYSFLFMPLYSFIFP